MIKKIFDDYPQKILKLILLTYFYHILLLLKHLKVDIFFFFFFISHFKSYFRRRHFLIISLINGFSLLNKRLDIILYKVFNSEIPLCSSLDPFYLSFYIPGIGLASSMKLESPPAPMYP